MRADHEPGFIRPNARRGPSFGKIHREPCGVGVLVKERGQDWWMGLHALQLGKALFAARNIRLRIFSVTTGGPLNFVQQSVTLSLPSEKFSTGLVDHRLKCFTPLA